MWKILLELARMLPPEQIGERRSGKFEKDAVAI